MKHIHYLRDGLAFCAITTWVVGGLAVAQTQTNQNSAVQPSQQQPGQVDQSGQQNGAAQQMPMGLGLHFEKQNTSGHGLEIAKVDPNSPAAQAGLQPHDRVITIDGRGFSQARHAKAYLSAQTGRPVPMLIDRNGRQLMVQVVPGRPEGDHGWLGILLFEENENGQQGQFGTGAQRNAQQQNTQENQQTANANANAARIAAHNAPGQKGARVAEVYPGSPAARAGLRPGDLVTQINGQKIDDSADLVALVYEMKPQTKAEFDIMRDNQEQKVPVTIGSRNNEFAESQFGPGQGQFGQEPWGQFGPGQQFGAGPEFANSNSLQRVEEEVRQLREEVRQLREQLQKK